MTNQPPKLKDLFDAVSQANAQAASALAALQYARAANFREALDWHTDASKALAEARAAHVAAEIVYYDAIKRLGLTAVNADRKYIETLYRCDDNVVNAKHERDEATTNLREALKAANDVALPAIASGSAADAAWDKRPRPKNR